MAWGFRKFSLNKRIAARTSLKRVVRHSLGLKAPKGWGWITNPKRATYNRAYYRRTKGCLLFIPLLATPLVGSAIVLAKIAVNWLVG
jgi:hypothetical protein